jgi:hypothetical protein
VVGSYDAWKECNAFTRVKQSNSSNNEDGGTTILRNVCNSLAVDAVEHLRRLKPWKYLPSNLFWLLSVVHKNCYCLHFGRIQLIWGTAVAQWLRYCATNEKVAGSIPDGVMEFFIDTIPSDRTMALRSTQHLTEMSICGRCVRLTTLPPSRAVVKTSGNLNFLEPSGPLQACNGTALPFFSVNMIWINLSIKTARWNCHNNEHMSHDFPGKFWKHL